ncbi:hypothetical protein KI387_018926 [Taxus chinensis]|uniref:F-box protein n=1 Tax=Taxus chinensis TaxID=29808 RepID=A0AA38G6D9_TAXCH|nr:hypothetical protein KI387_018926 [Taxus chinensis]
MPLNTDVITQIFGRVDTITLANAACVSSHFWFVAKQENMWEEACYSLWPSTMDPGIRQLISSSLGGFRKFYASCFPSIAYDDSSENDSNYCNEMKRLHDVNTGVPSPSDFLWIVDVQYKNKPIFSKFVLGIPYANNFPGWFSESSFRVDMVNVEEEDGAEDGLPTIMSVDKVGIKDGRFWEHLMDNIMLSWIVINRRTGQAVNLSSWCPLAGQRHSSSDSSFLMRFGSILPAHEILPCKFVQCILEMKFRASHSDNGSLKIVEVSMHFEDKTGDDV